MSSENKSPTSKTTMVTSEDVAFPGDSTAPPVPPIELSNYNDKLPREVYDLSDNKVTIQASMIYTDSTCRV